jgi:hypothetical protein
MSASILNKALKEFFPELLRCQGMIGEIDSKSLLHRVNIFELYVNTEFNYGALPIDNEK